MTLNFGSALLIFIVGILVTIIVTSIVNYQRMEYSCTTCGKRHQNKSTLIQCPTCRKWFCANNLEKIEEAHTTSQRLIEIIPSKQTPEYPCGTKYLTMGRYETIYCKKDSKRFPFTIKLSFDRTPSDHQARISRRR